MKKYFLTLMPIGVSTQVLDFSPLTFEIPESSVKDDKALTTWTNSCILNRSSVVEHIGFTSREVVDATYLYDGKTTLTGHRKMAGGGVIFGQWGIRYMLSEGII